MYGLRIQQSRLVNGNSITCFSVSGWLLTKLLSCGCVLTRDQGNEFLDVLVLVFFDCCLAYPCCLTAHATRTHVDHISQASSKLDTLQLTSHMLTRILTLVVFFLCDYGQVPSTGRGQFPFTGPKILGTEAQRAILNRHITPHENSGKEGSIARCDSKHRFSRAWSLSSDI